MCTPGTPLNRSVCQLLLVTFTSGLGCGPWIVPFPQPMLSLADLGAVPDDSARAGVGVTALSLYAGVDDDGQARIAPIPGASVFTLQGTARLDAGLGFGGGWDVQAVASPIASGSQYDLRVGRRLYGSEHVRFDVVGGGGATWFASSSDGHEYGYFALAPHLGPRVAFRVGRILEIPILAEASWSHVVPVYGTDATDVSAWWLDVGAAAVLHSRDGFSVGLGAHALTWVDAEVPVTTVQLSLGVSYTLPLHRVAQPEVPSEGGQAVPSLLEGDWCDRPRAAAIESSDTPELLFRLIVDAQQAARCPGAPADAVVDRVFLERMFLQRYPDDALATQVQAWLDADVALE